MTPNKLAMLRLWLSERSAPLGLLVATCLAIGMFLVVKTVGAPPEIQGRILNFGIQETDTGSYPLAVVRLVKGEITVRLPRVNSCRVGDNIHLKRQGRLWGSPYSAAIVPCA